MMHPQLLNVAAENRNMADSSLQALTLFKPMSPRKSKAEPGTVAVTITWPSRYLAEMEEDSRRLASKNRSHYFVTVFEQRRDLRRALDPLWDAILNIAVHRNVGPITVMTRLLEIGLRHQRELDAPVKNPESDSGDLET